VGKSAIVGIRPSWLSMLVLVTSCTSGSGGGNSPSDFVGPSGGKLRLSDGTEFSIPAGAVSSGTQVRAAITLSMPAAAPRGLELAGSVHAFTPHGTPFSAPARIVLPRVGGGALYTLSDEADTTWELVESVQAASTSFVVTVDHISFFAEFTTVNAASDASTRDASTSDAASSSEDAMSHEAGGGRSPGDARAEGTTDGGERGIRDGGDSGRGSLRCGAVPSVAQGQLDLIPSLGPVGQMVNGFDSWASGVSADGSTVVGASHVDNDTTHAYRWTKAGGTEDLSTAAQETITADLVNCDGSVVAGTTASGATPPRFRWTRAGGLVPLPLLPDTTVAGVEAMNADGTVIVGECQSGVPSPSIPVRWTDSGMNVLPVTDSQHGWALGVSADGLVVAGTASFDDSGLMSIFRWSEASGLTIIDIDGAGSVAKLSADGQNVFAMGPGATGFIWNVSGSRSYPPCTGADLGCNPVALSQHGDIALFNTPTGAQVWSARRGARSLMDVATAAGVDLRNWTQLTPYAMTPDARVFVGLLYKDAATTAAFRLTLPEGTID